MPPAIPNYDLGLLITLDIGFAMITVLGMMIGFWAIAKQNINIARIAERIDARLRRDFPNIGEELGD